MAAHAEALAIVGTGQALLEAGERAHDLALHRGDGLATKTA
jgi:hypothetical protein